MPATTEQVWEEGWKVDLPKKKEEEDLQPTARLRPHVRDDVAPEEPMKQYKDAADVVDRAVNRLKRKVKDEKSSKVKDSKIKKWPKLREDEDEDDVQALTHMKNNKFDNKVKKEQGARAEGMKPGKTKYQCDIDLNAFMDSSAAVDPILQKYLMSIQPWETLVEKLLAPTVDESILFWPFKRFTCADYTVMNNGRRRAGKTTLTKNMVRKTAPMYPRIYMFSKTKHNGSWNPWLPVNAIHDRYSDGSINEMIKEQRRMTARNIRAIEKWKETEEYGEGPDDLDIVPVLNPYTQIIMDDCIDQHMHYSQTIAEIGYYSRHDALSLWINTQFGHAVNTGLRGNTDLAIGFAQIQKNQRETFRDEYMGFAGKKSHFDTLYDGLTQDRHFVALHLANSSVENRFDILYHGTPDPKDTEPIKLCTRDFWDRLSDDGVH